MVEAAFFVAAAAHQAQPLRSRCRAGGSAAAVATALRWRPRLRGARSPDAIGAGTALDVRSKQMRVVCACNPARHVGPEACVARGAALSPCYGAVL